MGECSGDRVMCEVELERVGLVKLEKVLKGVLDYALNVDPACRAGQSLIKDLEDLGLLKL